MKNNNTEKILSIIIPYHNECYDYTHKLFSSFDNQIAAPWDNIEIIISNNCYKPKNKRLKLNTYKNIKADIKFVYPEHRNNIGVSRQCGEDNAIGKYVMYCDSDDILVSNRSLYDLFMLFNKIESEDPDIIFLREIEERYDEESGSRLEDLSQTESIRWVYIHDKIYKRSFLNKNNIRFCDFIKYNEDGYYNFISLFASPKIYSTDLPVYMKVYNHNSVSGSKNRDFIYYVGEQVAISNYYAFKFIIENYNYDRLFLMEKLYEQLSRLHWFAACYYQTGFYDPTKAERIGSLIARNINVFDPKHEYLYLLDNIELLPELQESFEPYIFACLRENNLDLAQCVIFQNDEFVNSDK